MVRTDMVDSRIFSSTFSAGVTNFEVDIDDEKSLHKFIEHLFVINKGSEKEAVKLLPLKHDEKVIYTLNRVLENYRRDRDDEEGRILCAVLTVLSFYNNPESLDILEDSVLGISQYMDLEEYDYLRLIRYYTFAIAHSEGFTDQLITFYLRVLEKFPELDQTLYYLTMRHPCDHLVRKVISHKPSSRK
ncbi:MAG: hypothetical protein PQJ50_13085, partial [Spirochaetales bacterium]|nr:hypothetical protein [Spirochaetales bacterium]